MNLSKTEKRLDIARRLCQALVAQDPDRVIILCDSSGQVVASMDCGLTRVIPEIA
jgi:hypothetical protein